MKASEILPSPNKKFLNDLNTPVVHIDKGADAAEGSKAPVGLPEDSVSAVRVQPSFSISRDGTVPISAFCGWF